MIDDLNRLGYGGGFYDRYLEKNYLKLKKFKIGLGFSFQETKNIPINKYDKKLDLIITDKKLYNENFIFRRCCWNFRCSKLTSNLLNEISENKIDFVIVNGENAAVQGVGLTKEICKDFFNCGVDVITTGNHVWDQKEIMEFIDKEERLLSPKNLFEPAPGKGFRFIIAKNDIKIGVLN